MSSKSGTGDTMHVTDTKFWNTFMHDVFGPRKGGAIVFIDAENARKGVAKTSAAVAFARLFSRAFDYELQKDDLTLSGSKYLRRYQEHPGKEQPSVLVLDEFVGAGSGDARRAMSHQNIDFGRAWQLLRAKRVVTLATLPDWNEADPRLQKYADYRLWCLERPIGFVKPYKVTVPFNASGGTQVKTKKLSRDADSRRIGFPNMDAENDPFYEYLTNEKAELINSRSWDADALEPDEKGDPQDPEEVKRREAIKYTIRLYKPWDEENDTTLKDVADVVGEADEYKDSWVGNRVTEWRDGKHRDLVPDPTE